MAQLDIEGIGKNLRNLIRELLGMPDGSVRPANQNAPTGKMDEPFATVLLTTIDPVGVDFTSFKDVDDVPDSLNSYENITGMRHIVASVQFFRKDAVSRASRLQALLRSSHATEFFQQAQMGLVKVGSPTNLTQTIDTYWEERAQVEVELYCISDEQVSVPTFGTFPVVVDSETATNSSEVTK